MRRMIGNELDRCGNHLRRASRNRNPDRLTAAYNSQDREELLARCFHPQERNAHRLRRGAWQASGLPQHPELFTTKSR